MHHKLTSNISMSRGLICVWTKETNLGKHLFIFRRLRDIWGCLKNLQFCELRYPMCIICIRRGTNIAIEANVRAMTQLYNKSYKNFTRSCLHRKNKWKHKFVNYVTVNCVTIILLKSKYLSKCIHELKKRFVFNQSKSVPVNKDQFKPYCSCHFI